LNNYEVQYKTLEAEYKFLSKDLDIANKTIYRIKERDLDIILPKTTLNETEAKLRQWENKRILEIIINYLDLDNYSLIKNLANITNKDNVIEVIAHKNGALQRNLALKQLLKGCINEKKEFKDKMTWEYKNKI